MVKKKDSSKVKELKHRARRFSIKEGIFAAGKNSVGDSYVSPFAIAINASNSVVALISSISGLLGPLGQIFGSRLIEKSPRKKVVLRSVFLESVSWLFFVGIAFLFYKGILVPELPLFLLLSFSFYVILSNVGHPAWFSWMGDIIDDKYRGRWFSKRDLLRGFVSIVLAISAAFFLDYFKKNNWVMLGFMILFFLAFVFRMICWKLFHKQYEPKIKLKKGYYFSFWDFLIEAPKNNFGKFALYRFFLNFACAVSSALMAVYLLRYLGFSYVLYMVIIFAATIFSLLVLELWGKFADNYGNYRVLVISSILIPTIPILWILSPSPLYLIFIPPFISGVFWAGFNLAARNFVYDNVSQQKRGLAVSYLNMLGGLGTFFGAGVGAILIKFLVIDFVNPIVAIFFLGGILRMIVVFFGISKLKETRKTKKYRDGDFTHLVLKEAKPTLFEEIHEIISIKKYLFMK